MVVNITRGTDSAVGAIAWWSYRRDLSGRVKGGGEEVRTWRNDRLNLLQGIPLFSTMFHNIFFFCLIGRARRSSALSVLTLQVPMANLLVIWVWGLPVANFPPWP